MADGSKLYLGRLEKSRPDQTRIFGEVNGRFLDLNLACAAYLHDSGMDEDNAYKLADFYFPQTIAAFLERGDLARKALVDAASFAQHRAEDLRGPNGEKTFYQSGEIRILPPLLNPEKSFVVGFSDQARSQAIPKSEIPTGFYKLPQFFITSGAAIVWPKFAAEIDADACLALVVGKPGRRVRAEKIWEYLAGVTLLIDITARDINRREGLTTNNLLGKNFPSSASLGPAVWLPSSRAELESLAVELAIDGTVEQRFSLSQCVFTIEQIIAHWSIIGIKPGDWLAIGASMALTGDRLQNPVPLKIGSAIRCFSPAIGELSHKIVSAEGFCR